MTGPLIAQHQGPPRSQDTVPSRMRKSTRRTAPTGPQEVCEREFESFARATEPALKAVLHARLGPDRGQLAVAEALAWAWVNWSKLPSIDHPIRYLARVGTSRTRLRRIDPKVEARPPIEQANFEPKLDDAMAALSRQQRVCVVLIAALEFSFAETADHLGLSKSTVQRHYERGIEKLRNSIDPPTDESDSP